MSAELYAESCFNTPRMAQYMPQRSISLHPKLHRSIVFAAYRDFLPAFDRNVAKFAHELPHSEGAAGTNNLNGRNVEGSPGG